MAMDTTCLFSVVKNVSGVKKRFTCLPPHGRELDANEELSIFGSVLEAVNRGDRYGDRWMNGLEAAVENGDLEIRALPKPILVDELTPDVKMVSLIGGSLTLEDPCWESLSVA